MGGRGLQNFRTKCDDVVLVLFRVMGVLEAGNIKPLQSPFHSNEASDGAVERDGN